MLPKFLKKSIRFYQKQLKIFQSNPKNAAGFTLYEILFASIIGTIVTSSILGVVNTMLQYSTQEVSQGQTQQQMNSSLSYITEDLRQAVYVYTGEGLEKITQYLPFKNDTEKQPILAFWKVESLPYSSTQSFPADCDTFSDELKDECESLQIERNSYTLVVYLQSVANPSNVWNGESRIERYQLRKYSNMSTLTKNNGYVDPRKQSSFGDWPIFDDENLQVNASSMTAETEVLVDFVHYQDLSNPSLVLQQLPECITDTSSANPYFASPVYDSAIPADKKYSRGFFACVSFVDTDNDLIPDLYQDIKLFVRGNAKGKKGYKDDDSFVLLQTQVMTKGVIQKASTD